MTIINSSIAQPCYSAPEVTPTLEKTKRERGFYAMVPRIVIKDTRLTHAEKTFYMCLKDMCGDTATCFRSMRTLAEETGISASSLSHMIPHLQELGYIHGEKKARGYGGPPIWHISIIDIWEENREYCAKNVQLSQVDESVVQNLGSVVQEMHKESEYCANFGERCANFTDRRRYSEEDSLEEYNEEEGEEDHKEPIPFSCSREIRGIGTSLQEAQQQKPSWVKTAPTKAVSQKLAALPLIKEERPLTKNEQRYLNEQERDAIWKVIEDVFHTTFPYRVRTQRFNTRGMDGIIEDGFTPDDVRKALTGMEKFHRNNLLANFSLEKLHPRLPGLLAAKEQENEEPTSKKKGLSQADIDALPPPSPDCLVPWGVYTDLGLYWWQDQYRTLEEADALGYNGGFGYYHQQKAPPSWREEEEVCNVN